MIHSSRHISGASGSTPKLFPLESRSTVPGSAAKLIPHESRSTDLTVNIKESQLIRNNENLELTYNGYTYNVKELLEAPRLTFIEFFNDTQQMLTDLHSFLKNAYEFELIDFPVENGLINIVKKNFCMDIKENSRFLACLAGGTFPTAEIINALNGLSTIINCDDPPQTIDCRTLKVLHQYLKQYDGDELSSVPFDVCKTAYNEYAKNIKNKFIENREKCYQKLNDLIYTRDVFSHYDRSKDEDGFLLDKILFGNTLYSGIRTILLLAKQMVNTSPNECIDLLVQLAKDELTEMSSHPLTTNPSEVGFMNNMLGMIIEQNPDGQIRYAQNELRRIKIIDESNSHKEEVHQMPPTGKDTKKEAPQMTPTGKGTSDSHQKKPKSIFGFLRPRALINACSPLKQDRVKANSPLKQEKIQVKVQRAKTANESKKRFTNISQITQQAQNN